MTVIVLAIVAWQIAAHTGPSSADRSSASTLLEASDKPGLTLFPPEARVTAPALHGRRLGGGTYSSRANVGHVVVINVWGSWCGPCRAETPDLVRLADTFHSQDVRFVGINTRDNEASARAFVRKFQVPYPSVVDNGDVLLSFRGVIPTAVVPSTIVIDKRGRVAARILGRATFSTVRGLVEDELTTPGQPSSGSSVDQTS